MINQEVWDAQKAERAAWAIMGLFEKHGIAAVVAGGAARDTYHGVTPKDYDIVIINNDDTTLARVTAALAERTLQFEDFSGNASMGGSPHLEWVLQVEGCVDIIAQTARPTSINEVLENFDFTLNMAYFERRGYPKLHERYPAVGEEVVMLDKCDDPVNRSCYLSKKYPQYVWPFNCPPSPLAPVKAQA